ncbi:CLUMA_CG018375, isoform A [Clunio marinus]|uniref:CLUMA_CG018375, isoform A n=1 Tax=Clunio marinus TaxID=568069 RepID=A0A1J1J132_9DIPT|nr:CLUMA_CG018375, isoform A [Clunio marinus]
MEREFLKYLLKAISYKKFCQMNYAKFPHLILQNVKNIKIKMNKKRGSSLTSERKVQNSLVRLSDGVGSFQFSKVLLLFIRLLSTSG